jgi:TfoX/Sxy family transcriptional regulator of competence genes
MAYDEQLANRIRQAFGARDDITERKMFGGLAFLCLGRMCCGIVGSDLMVRIPDDECDAVMRNRYVRPMDFTGRPLKGFVYVSAPGFRTRAALRGWLSRGERVAEEKAAGLAKGRSMRPPPPRTMAHARRPPRR